MFRKKSYLKENITKPENGSLQEILHNSQQFPREFPVISVLCKSLLKSDPHITQEILEHHANSAYPLLHESALGLYIEFLKFKKKHGSKVEKSIYKGMSLIKFVQRLIEKRAIVFGGNDQYLLLSGQPGIGEWETVGTDQEMEPLVLKQCLSYDEMKLSAFLSFTSYSVFINDGNRRNCGIPSNSDSFQRHGVVVGLTGARLSDGPILDFQEIVVTEDQNTHPNGYGGNVNKLPIGNWRQIWADFYGVPNLALYKDVESDHKNAKEVSSRYLELSPGEFFDNEIYSKRICIIAETLLLEAEARAASEHKKAYVHVVGFGLGVWMLSFHQEKLFLDSFAKCLTSLQHVLSHISDVNFAWFKENSCGGVLDGGIIGNGESSIKIHFSKRPPHSKLEDDDKLLVVSYAWNGNAFPGNSFWLGSLDYTGDCANASSTQVSELQNPYVNRRKICGANLHIASRKWGILHISEYIRQNKS